MVITRIIILALASCLVMVAQPGPAEAHWDMESRFWQDRDNDEMFHFRLHNGTHANRQPVRRNLKVCFWLEMLARMKYEAISGKQCSITSLAPDEWKEFAFRIYELSVNNAALESGKLKQGVYRAKASAREQKNKISALLFGAALERQGIDLEYKDGRLRPRSERTW